MIWVLVGFAAGAAFSLTKWHLLAWYWGRRCQECRTRSGKAHREECSMAVWDGVVWA